MAVDKYGTMNIQYSFHGYATTMISMPEIDIDGLISLLQESKILLDREDVVRKLKGE